MQREILFRGLRADGSGWVYGDLLTKSYPITSNYKPPFILDEDGMWEVDPSTVGQYVGLTDKNGVKIFEGDVTDQEVEPDPWIPVSERLPEFDESVLVFCRIYGRFLATYEYIGDFDGVKYGNWRDFKGQLGILPPTHWMPLHPGPKPPKST